MNTNFDLCHPREDVISGRLRDEEFANDDVPKSKVWQLELKQEYEREGA